MPLVNGLLVSDAGRLQVVDSAPVGNNYVNGIAVDTTGQAYIDELGTALVPDGSKYVHGLPISPTKRLCMTLEVPTAIKYVNGLMLRASDGAIHATTSAGASTDQYVNGLVVSSSGRLRIEV